MRLLFNRKEHKDFRKENAKLNTVLRYKRAWQAKPNSYILFGTKKSYFITTTDATCFMCSLRNHSLLNTATIMK
jgi:hypothetical protein